jgi:hypothetical protein
MDQELEDVTFDQLVKDSVADIHFGLLDGGSKGMRGAVYNAMSLTARWRQAQDRKAKKAKSVAERARDIRHDIAEQLAGHDVNVNGLMDSVIDKVLRKHLGGEQ